MQSPEGLEDSPFNRNTFFLHEMDKLTVVLMSIKRLNKERRPLAKPLNQHENKFYLTMDETVS